MAHRPMMQPITPITRRGWPLRSARLPDMRRPAMPAAALPRRSVRPAPGCSLAPRSGTLPGTCRHSWSAAKQNELNATGRPPRSARAMRAGSAKLRKPIRAAGWRSLSKPARSGCRAIASNTHAPATTHTADRHPVHSTSCGSKVPANMAPKGTPVCLREKILDRCCSGATRVSRCELAGFRGP